MSNTTKDVLAVIQNTLESLLPIVSAIPARESDGSRVWRNNGDLLAVYVIDELLELRNAALLYDEVSPWSETDTHRSEKMMGE